MGKRLANALKLIPLARATVPVAYVQVGLEVAEERGIGREWLLRDLSIDTAQLDRPDGRLPLSQCVRLISRVVRQTRDAGLGYEFGLRSNLAAHGSVGYGLMSHPTVGEALAFGLKYGSLRNPVLKLSLTVQGQYAAIEARETFPLGPMRQYAFDAVMISLVRIGRQISGSFKPELELLFDCDEPPHYARYRSRLPLVRFRAGVNQLRFPAEYLQRPLHTANVSSAKLVASQCERDLAVIDDGADLAARVRAMLADTGGRYPNLDAVAERLHLSGRSLKRKLRERGLSYLDLLEDARKRDSLQLLEDPALGVGEVAQRVGYSDPASFTRAFRKWTGRTPTDWRTRRSSC